MTTNDKKLYENGCACVRWNSAERRYEVYVLHLLDSWYPFTGKGAQEDDSLTEAKARCDLLRSGKPKEIKGNKVIYENECAAVCSSGNEGYGCFEVFALNKNGDRHVLAGSYSHYRYGAVKARALAKKHCDRLVSRGERRRIFLNDYPDTPDWVPTIGVSLGLVVFFLFWIGVAIKSGALSGMEDNDCFLLYPFTSVGADFLAAHWWQAILIILLSGALGALFLGLSCIRKFSVNYRLFTKIFGKTQAIAWSVLAPYWAIALGWRLIAPITSAMGYPHFIAATIYLAVIVWGIVDFMKYRKQPAWSVA